jgi:hypothetical protein
VERDGDYSPPRVCNAPNCFTSTQR